jgi:hypothetical protein
LFCCCPCFRTIGRIVPHLVTLVALDLVNVKVLTLVAFFTISRECNSTSFLFTSFGVGKYNSVVAETRESQKMIWILFPIDKQVVYAPVRVFG